MIRFTLPWAPSLNNAYPSVTRQGKTRRIKSKALLAYRQACGTHVLASSIPRFQFVNGERLAVWIFCRPPNARAFDLDNRVKAVLDVLTYCGVIGDDAQVDEIHVERGGLDAPSGHVVVQVGIRERMSIISNSDGKLPACSVDPSLREVSTVRPHAEEFRGTETQSEARPVSATAHLITDQRGVAASQPLPLKGINRETGRTGPAPSGRRFKSRARALSRVAIHSGREPRGDG